MTQINRRDFLKYAGTLVGATIGLNATAQTGFKINFNNIPPKTIYFGEIDRETHYSPSFTSRSVLIQETPEYKEIVKEKLKRGVDGKYGLLMADASARTIRWINDYAKNTSIDLVLESSYFFSERKNPFTEVPENLKELSLEQLLNQLDITYSIVEENKSE